MPRLKPRGCINELHEEILFDPADLARAFAGLCDGSDSFIQSLPAARAWIRSLSSKVMQAATGRQATEGEVRAIKQLATAALFQAPFLKKNLDDDSKGAILSHLSRGLGHACAPITPHGNGESPLSIAASCAFKIKRDAGAWVQSALDQGMPSDLLQNRKSQHDRAPMSFEMLPSSDSKTHPQFRLAVLCQAFGLASHWSRQDIFDQALNLEVEKWRRFRSRSPESLLDDIASEKAWDQGFSALCDAFMPEGSRLDPKRHASLLEMSCHGHLVEMLDLFISRDWLPINEWAEHPPEWLEKHMLLISGSSSSRRASIYGSPSEKLDAIALRVMAEQERIALSQTSEKKRASKRSASL